MKLRRKNLGEVPADTTAAWYDVVQKLRDAGEKLQYSINTLLEVDPYDLDYDAQNQWYDLYEQAKSASNQFNFIASTLNNFSYFFDKGEISQVSGLAAIPAIPAILGTITVGSALLIVGTIGVLSASIIQFYQTVTGKNAPAGPLNQIESIIKWGIGAYAALYIVPALMSKK